MAESSFGRASSSLPELANPSVHLGGRDIIGREIRLCEPSPGPMFGLQRGAPATGCAQVVPTKAINPHFTGDVLAIALANNLLAALLGTHIHHGNQLGIELRRVAGSRVVDIDDRALRHIVGSVGGSGNGWQRVSWRNGMACVVSINRFTAHRDAELDPGLGRVEALGARVAPAEHGVKGAAGAEAPTHDLVRLAESPGRFGFGYENEDPPWGKMCKVATRICRAAGISAPGKVRRRIDKLGSDGCGHSPI